MHPGKWVTQLKCAAIRIWELLLLGSGISIEWAKFCWSFKGCCITITIQGIHILVLECNKRRKEHNHQWWPLSLNKGIDASPDYDQFEGNRGGIALIPMIFWQSMPESTLENQLSSATVISLWHHRHSYKRSTGKAERRPEVKLAWLTSMLCQHTGNRMNVCHLLELANH